MYRRKNILPGFGITLGITVTMLSLIIIIPLASVLIYSFNLSFSEFFELITGENILKSFSVSILCSFSAAVINCVFGLILAWILVRYDFKGKRLIDSMIELPFALPTAVAGITLTKMYSDQGMMGKFLQTFGIKVSYTRIGIIIAMIFVGIPFVVRTYQPVIEKIPKELEEAGTMMGASRTYVFWHIIFPELKSPLLSGFSLAFARGLGEYGSVVYISGNSAKAGTQVVSYIIMQKLNSGRADYESAAAISLVLLIISFVIMLSVNALQIIRNRRIKR